MKYLKMMKGVSTDLASRNKREISVVLELGYDVTVICDDYTRIDGVLERCKLIRYHELANIDYNSKRSKLKVYLDRLRSMRAVAALKADVISCHDLQNLKYINDVNTLFPKNRRAKLVYDSHEFEYQRNEKRSVKKREKLKKTEKRLIEKCAFTITVNDSIADAVQKLHELKTRPIVVRSTPEFWHIDAEVISRKRAELRGMLGLPEDTFAVMYHGMLRAQRGIERMIEVIAMNPDIMGIILGDTHDEKYAQSLKSLAQTLGVANRIMFLPAVPQNILWQYVGAADLGFMLIENSSVSYYLSLPNKLFENIQSLTPVIGSDFPEIGKLIREYDIGIACDPGNISEIDRNVKQIRADSELYSRLKQNIARAKVELCWEREKHVLIQAYARLKEGKTL